MPDRFDSLRVRQLDRSLDRLRELSDVPRPSGGWIRAVREALGMTTRQLAQRMDVNQSTVSRYQKSETEGTITLDTLRRVAAALDCELVYALVPGTSIREMRRDRAREIARRRIEAVDASMELEDQAISEEEKERQIEELTRDILDEWPRTVWDER